MDTAALLARIAWVREPLSKTEHNRTPVDKRRPGRSVLMEYVHSPKDARRKTTVPEAPSSWPAVSRLEYKKYVRLSYEGDTRRMHKMKNGPVPYLLSPASHYSNSRFCDPVVLAIGHAASAMQRQVQMKRQGCASHRERLPFRALLID